MTEFRIMFNAYNGKGDHEYLITTEAIKAVEARLFLNDTICNQKGIVWIESREVTEWRKTEIK